MALLVPSAASKVTNWASGINNLFLAHLLFQDI
jgi:hypothetical protein